MEENTEVLSTAEQWSEDQLRRAGFLGKWIWVLFWLVIPSSIANVLSGDTLAKSFPQLRLSGVLLSLVTVIVYGVILLCMYKQHRSYLYAGFCMIVSGIICFGLELIHAAEIPGPWFLVALPADVLDLIAIYHEYHAHAAVLQNFDPEFSGKWIRLWYWYIGIFAAMAVGIILILVSPMIGGTAMMITSLAAAVVTIMKVVYLYQTAQIFRRIES